MNDVTDPEISKKRTMLFDFWKDIPVTCEMKDSCAKIAYQEVRGQILDILREGIVDEPIPEHVTIPRRHALSAQECQMYVSKRLERRVKLSNIYFHLNRLEEFGFIKEIVTIKGKKHDIAYYGRTAQLFHFGGSDSKEKSEEDQKFQEVMIAVLEAFNPTLEKMQITSLIDKLTVNLEAHRLARNTWFSENSQLLNSLEYDILYVDKFLKLLQMSSSENYQIAQELRQLLNFPHD